MITVYNNSALQQLQLLDSNSIGCIVTSPPYFYKRRYEAIDIFGGLDFCDHNWQTQTYYNENGTSQSSDRFHKAGAENSERLKKARWKEDTRCTKCGAWRGELGWEPTPDEFVQHLLLLTHQFKRVLKPSGIAWLNIGDSYNASRKWVGGVAPKSLFGIPARLQIGLMSQGWTIRDQISWVKRHPVPEPRVTDRCVSAHETIFMLTKASIYSSNLPKQTLNTWITERVSNVSGDKAPMHPEIAQRCIEYTLKSPGVVLDPMAGSGTTLELADNLGHEAIGIELNVDDYEKMRSKFGKLLLKTTY